MIQKLSFTMYLNGSVFQNPVSFDVEIDQETVIAVNFQAYDLNIPEKRLRTFTNTFSIPATVKNLMNLNFPANKNIKYDQAPARSVYNNILATYQLNNVIIFNKSAIKINSITDNRINISIIENNQNAIGLDLLKSISWDRAASAWDSLAAMTLKYLKYNGSYNYPVLENNSDYYQGTWAQFYNAFIYNNTEIIAGNYLTNTYNIDGNFETIQKLSFYNESAPDEENNGYGARFSIRIYDVFNALNWYYSNFGNTNQINFVFTIFNGNGLNKLFNNDITDYIFCPSIIIYRSGTGGGGIYKWWFEFRSDLATDSIKFAGAQDLTDKPKKTAHDFLMSCCQKFNWIISETVSNDYKSTIKLYRFNDINDFGSSNVVDWSDNFKRVTEFKPFTEAMFRDNYISYKHIFEGSNFRVGAKLIYSNNENLDYEGVYLNVNGYYPDELTPDGDTLGTSILAKLNNSKAFEEFVFLRSANIRTTLVTEMVYGTDNVVTYPFVVYRAVISVEDYGLLDTILKYPVVYKIEKWITLEEISKLNFFNQYYIDQLGGSFYINKITGYNPLKSYDATTIELIQISNKIPYNEFFTEFWEDGPGDPFTDGTGDEWIY